jgi:hypothetical protein
MFKSLFKTSNLFVFFNVYFWSLLDVKIESFRSSILIRHTLKYKTFMGISILGISGQYGDLGMITRPIWKCPCIKLFITYFRHLEKRHPYWPETKSRPIWASIWKWSCSNPITGYVFLRIYPIYCHGQKRKMMHVINSSPNIAHLTYRENNSIEDLLTLHTFF